VNGLRKTQNLKRKALAIERNASVPKDNKKERKKEKNPLLLPWEGSCDVSCNEYSAYVSILSNLIKEYSCFMSIELS
jgi:hypothetical protein